MTALLKYLFKIRYCKFDQDKELIKYFERLTSSLNIHNIFNPSFYWDEKVKIFAFRAIPNGSKNLESFISIEDKNGRLIKNISIDLREELGGVRLIDPKITKINSDLYITFNSGWFPKGNNIFIMKIYPEMESPKTIIYKDRQKQERNWAFFSEGGQVYALYWINPLKILKVKSLNSKTWEMEEYFCEDKRNNGIEEDLTVGTQLSSLKGNYYFVAHKKILLKERKVYLGRMCLFNFDQKEILLGKHWLSHSFKSLWGSKIKHNTNLFSCTYFSGIQVSNDYIKLGYGINDVAYGFSKHKLKEVFK